MNVAPNNPEKLDWVCCRGFTEAKRNHTYEVWVKAVAYNLDDDSDFNAEEYQLALP
jgi:hypothetical protein